MARARTEGYEFTYHWRAFASAKRPASSGRVGFERSNDIKSWPHRATQRKIVPHAAQRVARANRNIAFRIAVRTAASRRHRRNVKSPVASAARLAMAVAQFRPRTPHRGGVLGRHGQRETKYRQHQQTKPTQLFCVRVHGCNCGLAQRARNRPVAAGVTQGSRLGVTIDAYRKVGLSCKLSCPFATVTLSVLIRTMCQSPTISASPTVTGAWPGFSKTARR
jgi:hypothetical protein